MDPANKQRLTNILIMAGVLVGVSAFWLAFLSQRKHSTIHKNEAQLQAALKGIESPAGVKTISVTTLKAGKQPFAEGVYLTSSDYEHVKAHYMKEFPRHGFVYKPWNNSPGAYFCSEDYYAVLSTLESEGRPSTYKIFLTWKTDQC
jgi:hypothetical protein